MPSQFSGGCACGAIRYECSAEPVFIQNGASPKTRVLYAGSLDDPSWHKPSRDIYVASAQPWDVMHPDLPKDQKMPHW